MTWLAMLQCIDPSRPQMFARYANAKIPEISVGFFRSVDQHISVFGIPSGVGQVISVNQNLLPVSFLTNQFIIAVLFSSLTFGIRKRNKTKKNKKFTFKFISLTVRLLVVSPMVSPGHFPPVVEPACINTILRRYAHFWIFWRESFGARKKRLAARGWRNLAQKYFRS